MSVILPNIPSLGADVSPEVRRAFDEIRAYFAALGNNGGNVSINDLLASGSFVQLPNGSLSPAIDGYNATSHPPAPTNLTVAGGFNKIIISWTPYAAAWVGYTKIFRATVDDFGSAALVAVIGSPGALFVDSPADNLLSDVYYYWVRFVSINNVEGPLNATNGTVGSTADDPAYVLENLLANKWVSGDYSLDAVVTPSIPDGTAYKCTTAGTTGGSEPSWDTTLGNTTNDGTVVWECVATDVDLSALIHIALLGSDWTVAIRDLLVADATIKDCTIETCTIDAASIGDLTVSTIKIADEAIDGSKLGIGSISGRHVPEITFQRPAFESFFSTAGATGLAFQKYFFSTHFGTESRPIMKVTPGGAGVERIKADGTSGYSTERLRTYIHHGSTLERTYYDFHQVSSGGPYYEGTASSNDLQYMFWSSMRQKFVYIYSLPSLIYDEDDLDNPTNSSYSNAVSTPPAFVSGETVTCADQGMWDGASAEYMMIGTSTGTIYVSSNGGNTWAAASWSSVDPISDLTYMGGDKWLIYTAGPYVSSDNLATSPTYATGLVTSWAPIGFTAFNYSKTHYDPVSDKIFFCERVYNTSLLHDHRIYDCRLFVADASVTGQYVQVTTNLPSGLYLWDFVIVNGGLVANMIQHASLMGDGSPGTVMGVSYDQGENWSLSDTGVFGRCFDPHMMTGIRGVAAQGNRYVYTPIYRYSSSVMYIAGVYQWGPF